MFVGHGELAETEIMTTADVIISVLDPLYRKLLQTDHKPITLFYITLHLWFVLNIIVTSCSKSHMEEKKT